MNFFLFALSTFLIVAALFLLVKLFKSILTSIVMLAVLAALAFLGHYFGLYQALIDTLPPWSDITEFITSLMD